jgi:hypothetical protein
VPQPLRRPTSIKLFLADGEPSGLRIAEKSNWTGVLMAAARRDFAMLRARPECEGPGVYFLVGPGDDSGLPEVYVGEADDLRSRLQTQTQAQDFWTQVVVATAKDASLNKAHVRWLEAQLIGLGNEARRARMLNGNAGQPSRLSEADLADMQSFLEDILVVLPILGLYAFEAVRVQDESPAALLYLRGPDTDAQGYDGSAGFLVKAGSKGRLTTTPSMHSGVGVGRERLIRDGILAEVDGHLVLTEDFLFTSPSWAAAHLLGRNANGRTEWKDASGRTLKSIQDG